MNNLLRFTIPLVFAALIPMLALMGCADRSPKADPVERDTTITKQTSFTTVFLDSTELENFMDTAGISGSHQEQIRDFYKTRNYQYAWFTEKRLAEHTRSFWSLHNNYIEVFQDSSLKDRALHHHIDLMMEMEGTADIVPTPQLEMQFTAHFFEYSGKAYSGQIDPKKLQWYIPKKKINQVDLLNSLIASNGKDLEEWEPLNPYYRQLKSALTKYQSVSKNGGWKEITLEKQKKYKKGDSSDVIQLVKQRLHMTGEYEAESSPIYGEEFEPAVIAVQRRFGLREDGIISSTLINELNVPVDERIRQILINLERMLWVPDQSASSVIVVNIPEYRLHVVENNKRQFSMNIVVGKEAHNTVIFMGNIKYVVFSPYWNVPPSIVRNEILPAIKRNPGYLSAMNMEQTGTANGLPVIRQKPGAGNALGKVKFIFPNSYNIYLHDSPAKSLFKEQNRAYSHGCIRLAEPTKMAEYLLRHQPEWTDAKMKAAMNAGAEKWVEIKVQVPVLITYFTAWAGSDGHVRFRKDIYGHDARMAKSLFQNN